MSRKRHTTEQIVNKLRQADVELAKGQTVAALLRAFNGAVSLNEVLDMRCDLAMELINATIRLLDLAKRHHESRGTGASADGGRRFPIRSIDDIQRLKDMTGGTF